MHSKENDSRITPCRDGQSETLTLKFKLSRFSDCSRAGGTPMLFSVRCTIVEGAYAAAFARMGGIGPYAAQLSLGLL